MNKTIIIAEVGPNHNGKLKLAYKLVDVAKRAGADFCKISNFHTRGSYFHSC